MNKVQLVGIIGKEPVFKTIGPKATPLCEFSIATKESVKKDGAWVQESVWHQIVTWSKTAEFVHKYFVGGSWIGISGKISYSEYEKGGQKMRAAKIVADSVEFVGAKAAPKEAADDTIPW
jgi:single-strand DNA-binding protein